ncbi:type I DNA topoisomerase [Candidatus Saccharibacteria bacterium]|nr:type I DNA topoisomerase [Candidatus Saccharibacteria bacterium]
MAKNLMIVESPAKAKTIARYLGDDFEVKSSFGHVRDLPKKQLGVDIAKKFEPTYEISPDKGKIVSQLRSIAKGKTIWLASDEDREGEAIAWHICFVLGIDPNKTKRIVFHEITKSAIATAIAKPRTVDQKLVDSQQARRVLDRLVGYELSPILWKKIRAGLSAGRVQSVAVRLTVEREREIRAFQAEGSFKLSGIFDADGEEVLAELPSKILTEPLAQEFLETAKTATFTVESVDQKPATRAPSAPFTTSSLQQEAARRLGYGVKQTMTVAQRLYENGHITYMRTDSVALSGLAIKAARDYIVKAYGQNYHQVRQYKTKSRGAQEAHEAIRPTQLTSLNSGADTQQQKLYQLIWQRTVASQMAPAQIDQTQARISISGRDEQLVASGEILKFDGFLKVYGGGKEDKILPKLSRGQRLSLKTMSAQEVFSRAPARYSEASLVKKLEELGIGRPSTYAPTITTIQTRGYVEKSDIDGEPRRVIELVLAGGKISKNITEIVLGADRGKLIPTQLAEIVTDFLQKYFSSIIDYDFTARAEEELDDIAGGKDQWQEMLERFYKAFHPLIEKSKQASRDVTLQVRKLGKDPKSGQLVYARYGRFGPVLQLGDNPASRSTRSTKAQGRPVFDSEVAQTRGEDTRRATSSGQEGDKKVLKPRFAPMPSGSELNSVTLEQALPMFNLPRIVGKSAEGEEISSDIGPYGPYLKLGKQFVSIKDHDPLTISLEEALQLIEQKKQAIAEKVIADFGTIRVLNGPYGPYVSDGKKNARIPKGTKPKTLDKAQAQELLDKAPAKSKFRRRK